MCIIKLRKSDYRRPLTSIYIIYLLRLGQVIVNGYPLLKWSGLEKNTNEQQLDGMRLGFYPF